MKKVDNSKPYGPNGDCWNWIGSRDSWNYARIIVNGKNCTAHRISYRLFNGSLTQNQLVRHKCDIPHCINPKHLVVGSHADNVCDAYERHRYPTRKGIGNGNSKLSEAMIFQIKRLVELGFTYPYVANEYGVTSGTIGHIIRGLTWKHLNKKERANS